MMQEIKVQLKNIEQILKNGLTNKLFIILNYFLIIILERI